MPPPCPPRPPPSAASSRLCPQQGSQRGDAWSRPWLGRVPRVRGSALFNFSTTRASRYGPASQPAPEDPLNTREREQHYWARQIGPEEACSAPFWPPIFPGTELILHISRSAVRNHHLPKMASTLEVAVGLLRLAERKRPIDHRARAVHLDCTVHGLEISAATDADRAERDP